MVTSDYLTNQTPLQVLFQVPAPYLKEPRAKENVKKVYDEIMLK